MVAKKLVETWLAEVNDKVSRQPSSTWTIARMRIAYPNPGSQSIVQIDTVAAAGACNAVAMPATFNRKLQRVEIAAAFDAFELRGRSSILGDFRILLQSGKRATGRFRQIHLTSVWPIHGSWSVPFVIETQMGRLIPRPTDEDVLLKSAAPGEFAIPPIGVWFEKWDPINLVLEGDPNGPTLAVCEEAMHCMVNVGPEPSIPEFYVR